MNFHYSTYTTHRPNNHSSSNFNEDARCDNEVNLILEKNYNQQLIEQSIIKEQQQQQQSVVVNQTDQYYFMPIREQSSIMALSSTNNTNVPDSSSSSSLLLLTDLQNPSRENLFDYSISTSNSTTTTVNKNNDNYNLTDADLAALFVSSIVSTTPSITTENTLENSNTLDDVFIQQMNDLVCSNQQNSFGPPPGFENFRLNSSDNSTALQSQVSSSDTINFGQLLQPTISVDSQTQQPTTTTKLSGNIRSSSSSHSSFTSDEQSIFFPLTTHHYSTSQMSNSTTTNSIHTNAKPFIPASLSNSSSAKIIDHQDVDLTPNHIFTSSNSFFTNGHHQDLVTTNRQSSSSTSSSSTTSSSIDDALIQLTQQQPAPAPPQPKLFSNESLSIFNLPSNTNLDKQQLAVHENINFLASMAVASTPVTPESPWQSQGSGSGGNHNHNHHQRNKNPILTTQTKQSPSKISSINMQDLIENLNEICYRGFDELNALIQEQRWVQNYLNINSSSSNSPLVNVYGTNSCSARVLIIPEYFIFKCKKIELTASHVYELLANGRPELRLKDIMFVFKSWKESITNAELIHQEEEMKLRLTTEHSQTYYMNDNVLQAAFERVSYAIRELCSMTQRARAAFQYATLNVFQMSSRQQQNLSSSTSNLSQSTNAIAFAQLQAVQQQKSSSSSSVHRLTNTTP